MNLGKQLRPQGKRLPSYASKQSELRSSSLSTSGAAGISQTNHSFTVEYVSPGCMRVTVSHVTRAQSDISHTSLLVYVCICNEEFLTHTTERVKNGLMRFIYNYFFS